MWRIAGIALGLAAAAGRASAQAPTADKDEAARLFQEANALRDGGRFTEACDRFARSYVLDHAVGTELNLADCAERQNQLGRAWQLYDDASREAARQGNSISEKYARDHAAALAPKLATLVVRIAEPGAPGLAVKIAGRTVAPAAEITRLDDAGPIDIDVTAANAQPFHTTASATRGETTVVEVPRLTALVAPPPPPPPEMRTRRDPTRVKIALGVGGVGAAALGFSLGYALVARHSYTSALEDAGCTGPDNRQCPSTVGRDVSAAYDTETRHMRQASIIAIGGVALVGVAAAIFFTAPRETVTIAPIATATSAGVGLSGSF